MFVDSGDDDGVGQWVAHNAVHIVGSNHDTPLRKRVNVPRFDSSVVGAGKEYGAVRVQCEAADFSVVCVDNAQALARLRVPNTNFLVAGA